MPSLLAWLDFAESDRQRAMDVINLFRERNTVDELGFAPVRDALSDLMFPGTSTIQTRARYFLFVPWIMLDCERNRYAPAVGATRIRRLETQLIDALLAGAATDSGIIGREARGTLKRMPSSVYWGGLHRWGIRTFSGSIEQYLLRVATGHSGPSRVVTTDDGEPVDAVTANWHPGLPAAAKNVFKSTDFDLTPHEAEFLHDRILGSCPRSLLAHLMTRLAGPSDCPYIWELPILGNLTAALSAVVNHARLFSWCAWGGPLLYACLIAKLKHADAVADTALTRLHEWRQTLQNEQPSLSRWNRREFWSLIEQQNPRLSPRTQAFSDRWIDIALSVASGAPAWEDPAVQRLIIQREHQLKGSRSRLIPDNLRARDRWQGDGNDRPMDFRWAQTQIILNDIIKGLHAAAPSEEDERA